VTVDVRHFGRSPVFFFFFFFFGAWARPKSVLSFGKEWGLSAWPFSPVLEQPFHGHSKNFR
jgi:hypothetical protein